MADKQPASAGFLLPIYTPTIMFLLMNRHDLADVFIRPSGAQCVNEQLRLSEPGGSF
ncbi:MAG: hypothetical protein ACKVOX_11760 [Rhizobacter sp.]